MSEDRGERRPRPRGRKPRRKVCSFCVDKIEYIDYKDVNRRRSANSNQPEADFFRVTAWRQLGENCQRYLAKGRKVAVVGPVSVQSYTGNDGNTRFSLEVQADDVEFLSPRNEDAGYAPAVPSQPAPAAPAMNGFEEVDDEDLPF